MRLHRVEVQAFGPFAGREVVDVDSLSEHGLFLLHGPTGAGKTSVLDAVCFALYGRVPGSRATGTRLRSDHAPAGLRPEVLVDVTVSGRRFEVTRSPAWDRPKKRGSGVTTEQARTLLRELVDGAWVPRSSRNDEASQLLTDCLGMGLEQFTKVVLLPQGDFAAFLRASAEDRRPLLQRLFGTERFEAVEAWLADRRRDLARELEQSEAALGRLLARVHEAAADLPNGDAGATAGAAFAEDVGGQGDPVDRVLRLTADARQLVEQRKAEHVAATAERDAARLRVEALTAESGRAERLSAVLSEQATLAEADEAAARSAALLDRARAASVVAGDLRAAAQASDELRAAERALQESLGLVAAADPGLVARASTELESAAASTREELGRLDGLLDLDDAFAEQTARRQALADECEALTAELATLDDAIARAAEEMAAHTESAASLQGAAAELARAAHAVQDAEAVLLAAREHALLTTTQAQQGARVSEAVAAEQAAREHWLDLRERRLAGMAAELAGQLTDGEPCAVCGATEHPAPATPAPGSVTADAEQEARDDADRAAQSRDAAERALAATREQLAVQAARCGGLDVQAAEQQLAAARSAHRASQQATAHLDQHRSAAEQAATERKELTDRRHAAAQDVAATTSLVAELDRSLAELRARVDKARGEDATVRQRRQRLGQAVAGLDALLAARRRVESASRAAQAAHTRAEAAAVRAGFESADVASAAALDPEAHEQLEAAVRQHADARAAVQGRLAEPELRLAAQEERQRSETGTTLADLRRAIELAMAAASDAEAAAQACAGALAVAQRASTSLALLTEQVTTEIAATAPLRERFAVADDLSQCVEGRGGGNTLRMRLSSYVLAARLEQVAAAATVRLADMSLGRFSLVHTDAAERGGRRSGLGLQVLDGWTGQQRETSSLSGGESFLASLALALGLADVVQAEAGGTAIETLFVDEGFGSLDPESLEEVMAVLDALRDGGRSVGLISHVPELRQRIPAQLEVVKTRAGSHLRAGTAA